MDASLSRNSPSVTRIRRPDSLFVFYAKEKTKRKRDKRTPRRNLCRSSKEATLRGAVEARRYGRPAFSHDDSGFELLFRKRASLKLIILTI